MAAKKNGDGGFAGSVADALANVRVGDHARAWDILERWEHKIPTDYGGVLPPSPEAVLCLRVATLVAEIAERRGDKAHGARVLLPLDRIIEDVKSTERSKLIGSLTDGSLEWRYFQQKLYYVWQRSVLAYRKGDLDESTRLLNLALRVAQQLDSRPESLLANLYYGAGKLALRELNYTRATAMFRHSVVSASRGLAAARSREIKDLALAERAAQYSIAKAIALGMGHCLHEQGRVEEAHTLIVAGQLLLGLGRDRVLADHAALLLASVERGAAGERNKEYLEAAANRLKSCAGVFENQLADTGYQWRYERALLEMQRGNLDTAETQIRELIEIVKGSDDRWFADAYCALSRIERRRLLHSAAVESARMAVSTAIEHRVHDVEQRARTMLIAALYEKSYEPGIDRALRDDLLTEAEEEIRRARLSLREDDVRNRANLRLQEARLLNARGGRHAEAERAFQDYLAIRPLIDVGRIREFEEVVKRELAGGRYVSLADGTEPDYDLPRNREHLDTYILQKVNDLGLASGEQPKRLGISKAQFYQLLKSLGLSTPTKQNQKPTKQQDNTAAAGPSASKRKTGRAGGI